jgi:hypothetical protein
MANTTGIRYSQNKKDIGDAKNFRWEYPVPENKFWDDFTFVEARNFLQSFSPAELENLPIDPNSTQDKKEKLELLLKLLHDKLAAEDAAAEPETFYDVNFDAWDQLYLGVFTVKHALGHADAEDTLRMMIDRRKYKSNYSHQHTLSVLLFDQGKYAEAEETEIPVKDWLDGRLGKDSPQALGSRRIIGRAIWKQGPERRDEAKEIFAEVMDLVEGMTGGKYAVYQDEMRETTEKMARDLEEGRL